MYPIVVKLLFLQRILNRNPTKYLLMKQLNELVSLTRSFERVKQNFEWKRVMCSFAPFQNAEIVKPVSALQTFWKRSASKKSEAEILKTFHQGFCTKSATALYFLSISQRRKLLRLCYFNYLLQGSSRNFLQSLISISTLRKNWKKSAKSNTMLYATNSSNKS